MSAAPQVTRLARTLNGSAPDVLDQGLAQVASFDESLWSSAAAEPAIARALRGAVRAGRADAVARFLEAAPESARRQLITGPSMGDEPTLLSVAARNAEPELVARCLEWLGDAALAAIASRDRYGNTVLDAAVACARDGRGKAACAVLDAMTARVPTTALGALIEVEGPRRAPVHRVPAECPEAMALVSRLLAMTRGRQRERVVSASAASLTWRFGARGFVVAARALAPGRRHLALLARTQSGSTPLHLAFWSCDVRAVKAIVRLASRVGPEAVRKAFAARDGKGRQPLDALVCARQDEAMALLDAIEPVWPEIDGPLVVARRRASGDRRGREAVIVKAARKGAHGVVEWMLDRSEAVGEALCGRKGARHNLLDAAMHARSPKTIEVVLAAAARAGLGETLLLGERGQHPHGRVWLWRQQDPLAVVELIERHLGAPVLWRWAATPAKSGTLWHEAVHHAAFGAARTLLARCPIDWCAAALEARDQAGLTVDGLLAESGRVLRLKEAGEELAVALRQVRARAQCGRRKLDPVSAPVGGPQCAPEVPVL